MPEGHLTALVGDLYDAATGGLEWTVVGDRLYRLVGGSGATLRIDWKDSAPVNVLQSVARDEAAYAGYFHRIDPVRAAAMQMAPAMVGRTGTRVARELVPGPEFERSEFYADYARPTGRHDMLVGWVGNRAGTLLAIFRDHTAPLFSERERKLVEQLLPHTQRALQLHDRLAREESAAHLRFAALDRMPMAALIVDVSMHVFFANEAALAMVARRSAGLAIIASGPRMPSAHSMLIARHRGDNAALRSLVVQAAARGPGGAMRLHASQSEETVAHSVAILVSPAPSRVAATSLGSSALVEGLAMIMIQDLATPRIPRPALFSDLFGLSTSEAAVAVAMLGGRTAEEVAAARQVSLDTVRSQIRSVLRKSETSNLRDFERIGATLGAMAP